MTLRDLAATHRAQILGDATGIAEAIVYMPAGGDAVPGYGSWIQPEHGKGLSDARVDHGVGAAGTTNVNHLDIALALAPNLTRADQFKRVATGEVWGIEYIEVIAGVGWHITLTKPDEEVLRGGG